LPFDIETALASGRVGAIQTDRREPLSATLSILEDSQMVGAAIVVEKAEQLLFKVRATDRRDEIGETGRSTL
jgi:hypothetical protein